MVTMVTMVMISSAGNCLLMYSDNRRKAARADQLGTLIMDRIREKQYIFQTEERV